MPVRPLIVLILAALGATAFAHGDLELRIRDLTRRIETAGANAAPLYLERGELKRDHGDFSGAEQDYEAAAKFVPNSPEVTLCRGRVLADTGQLEQALSNFDKVAVACPEHPEVFLDRARLHLRMGHRREAIADYRKAAALAQPPVPEIWLGLAQALAAESQVPEALRAIDEGVEKTGPQLKLQSAALELELQRANTNGAIARIDKILEIAMRKETWWARRGDLLRDSGRIIEARGAYQQALKEIQKLPPRLQQTPATTALRKRVESNLNEAITGRTASLAWAHTVGLSA